MIRSDNGVLPNPLSTSQALRGSDLTLGQNIPPTEESGRSFEPGDMPESESMDSLEDIERRHILRVLERTGWVISGPNGAGAILNVHPNTLRSLMERLGIRRARDCSDPAQPVSHLGDGHWQGTRGQTVLNAERSNHLAN